jgi:hypothetical protein
MIVCVRIEIRTGHIPKTKIQLNRFVLYFGFKFLTAISEPECLENMGASTSHNPMGFHGPLQGYF